MVKRDETSDDHGPPIGLGGHTPSVSAVWAYFEKDAMGNSVCKFCARAIKGHHSSNLLSHLRTAGRNDAAHQQASALCEEHRENKRTAKRQKMAIPTAAEFATTYPHLIAAAAAAAVPALGGSTYAAFKKENGGLFPSSAQAMAAAAAAASLTREHLRERTSIIPQPLTMSPEQLTQDFVLMILTENLPFDFATQRGFHNFAHLLMGEKISTLPTTEVVVKHIEMFHESFFLTAKMFMARSKAIGLSLEAWRHPSLELASSCQYLVLRAHFSVNFRAYHIAISVIPVGTGIDRVTLKAMVDQQIERFAIRDKVMMILLGDLPWKQNEPEQFTVADTSCSFTPMPLDSRTAVPQPQMTVVMTSAVTLIRRCLNKDLFDRAFPGTVAEIDVYMRRCYHYPTIQAVIKRQWPRLSTTDSSDSYLEWLYDLQQAVPIFDQLAREVEMEGMPLLPQSIEWIGWIVKKLRPFLRYAHAFEGEQSKASGSEKEVHKDGLSSISTIAAALVAYTEKQAMTIGMEESSLAQAHGTNSNAYKLLFESLSEDIRFQFGRLPSICVAATLLDPRYKDREYCYLDPQVERGNAEACIREFFQLSGEDVVPTQTSPRSVVSTTTGMKHTTVDTEEEDDLLAHLPSTTGDAKEDRAMDVSDLVATWIKELSAFLSLPLAERNVDPILWWRSNALRFPLLAQYAELVLCLPAAANTGETVMERIRRVLSRVEGMGRESIVAENGIVAEALLCFQIDQDVMIEWFRSGASTTSEPSNNDVEGFRHIENV